MTKKKLSEASRKALEIIASAKPLEIVTVLVKDFSIQPKDACKATLNLLKHSIAMKKITDRELTMEDLMKEFAPNTAVQYPMTTKFRYDTEKNRDHIDEKQRFEKEKGQKFQSDLFKKTYDEYKSRSDNFLFAHFTNELPQTGGQIKVGLNPRSDANVAAKAGKATETFGTPIGIYAYPVFGSEQEMDIASGEVPFAGNRKYVVLFTVKPAYRNRIVILNEDGEIDHDSKIKEEDIERKTEELKRKYPELYKTAIDESKFDSTFGYFWNFTRHISQGSISKWTKMLKDMGIYGVIDYGHGLIHGNEPIQAVFFGKEIIQVIGADSNKGYQRSEPTKSIENAHKVAASSKNPELLRKILRVNNRQVLTALSENPNIPEDVALELTEVDYPVIAHYLLQNPASTERVVDKIFEEQFVSSYTKGELARSRKTSKVVLSALSKDEDEDIRTLVATHKNTPPEALLSLSKDKNEFVREEVAKNPSSPPEALEILAKDEDVDVLAGVVVNPNTPKDILKQLSNHSNPGIEKLAKYLQQLGENKIKRYVIKEDESNLFIARDVNTPSERLAMLAKDEDENVRRSVAGNPSTPPEALTMLAKDKEVEIRFYVARNHNTPSEILTMLAKDEDEDVRRSVAENTNTQPEALAILAKDEEENIRRVVAKKPNTPPEVLATLVHDEDERVREFAMSNPSMPPDAKYSVNKSQQKVLKIQKHTLDQIFEKIDDFLDKKGTKREYSWAEFSKYVQYNSQPKEVKDLLNNLNRNGKVNKDDVLHIENMLSNKIYGISYREYEGHQTLFEDDTKVIQLNLTKELDEQLKQHPEFYDFFMKVSNTSFQSSHPVVKGITIGWMRYYEVDKKTWLIEEIQTDILYAIKNTKVLQDVFGGNIEKQKEFIKNAEDFFGEWERALINHLKSLAQSKAIQNIFMVSDVIKQRTANLQGTAKLKSIYEKLPIKVGFKRLSFDDIGKYNTAIQTQMEPNEYIWYAKTQDIKENKKQIIKRYVIKEFWPEMNRAELPPDPVKKQTKWPYTPAQIRAVDPKSKSRKSGFGGMITAGKEAIDQIKFPPGKKVRAKGGDWGGSQGIQSKELPHAQDNPTSNGSTLIVKGQPGWSTALPTQEFEPPINNFGDKEKIKKWKFKKVVEENNSILREISEDEIDKISDYLGDIDKLSFEKIFKGKKRVMIPFSSSGVSPEMKRVLDFLKSSGYQVDLGSGVAEKEYEIPAGPKKGQKQKRQERIGKLLKKASSLLANMHKAAREKDAEGVKKYYAEYEKNFPKTGKYDPNELETIWNKKSGEVKKYNIIISRHPIDVLRMSDFQGIQSCHSVGGSYYQCAVAEAKGHGLVAFVVNAKDVPKDFDLEQDEIFKDKQRDVKGIEPISRIRLRKYVNKKNGEELAVPSSTVYGQAMPGLSEKITQWAREAQNIDVYDPPDMDDYVKYGGSYEEHGDTDGKLFNNLFNTRQYSGDIEHDSSDEDADLEEQYEEAAIQIEEDFKSRAKHAVIDSSIEDDGDGPRILFYGSLILTIPEISEEGLSDEEIRRVASKLDYSFDGSSGDDADLSKVNMVIPNDDYPPDPEGYRDFADFVLSEYEDKYEEIVADFKQIAIDEGYIQVSEEFSQLKDKIEEENYQPFNNFELLVEDGSVKINIELKPDKLVKVSYSGYASETIGLLKNSRFEWAIKNVLIDYYNKYSKKKADKTAFKDRLSIGMDKSSSNEEFLASMVLNVQLNTDDEVIKSVLDFAKFYDKNYQIMPQVLSGGHLAYLRAANIVQEKKTIEIDPYTISEKFFQIMSKIGQIKTIKTKEELADFVEQQRAKIPCEYIVLDHKSVLLRNMDFSMVDDLFQFSGETGPDFMKNIFYNLLKAYLVEFKLELKSSSPKGQSIKSLYLPTDKKFFANMPINLQAAGQPFISAIKQWGGQQAADVDDEKLLNSILKTDKLNQRDVYAFYDIEKLREIKKIKKYKYVEPELRETEDDLSKIPERDKPQKVGQPLPVAGWTGGMDPNKIIRRR